MFHVVKEHVYFVEENPEFLLPKSDPEQRWPVNENMIGTAQLIDDVWYHIKGVSYRMESKDKSIKTIIVE